MPGRVTSSVRRMLGAGRDVAWDVQRHKTVSLPPKGPAKGRVLLSYVTGPFSSNVETRPVTHSNQWECSEMAGIFQEMGYAVDVIDWDDSGFMPRGQYDIAIDIHGNLERLAPYLGPKCLKVLHITGSHWLHQNRAEYERLAAIRDRRGVALRPRRGVMPAWGIEAADCATVLGNNSTVKTWEFAGKKMMRIPATSPVYPPFNKGKDIAACKNRFVWLGGSGLALKGLDLTLEAVAEMPEVHLTVCGPVPFEEDFSKAYEKELWHSKNVRTAGWVDVGSDAFKAIADESIGFLHPSASEGASIAVLTCMAYGLIPIATRQSGIDISPFGIVLEHASVESVKAAIEAIMRSDPNQLRARAMQAHSFVSEKHSRQAFTEAYTRAAQEMVSMASERK